MPPVPSNLTRLDPRSVGDARRRCKSIESVAVEELCVLVGNHNRTPGVRAVTCCLCNVVCSFCNHEVTIRTFLCLERISGEDTFESIFLALLIVNAGVAFEVNLGDNHSHAIVCSNHRVACKLLVGDSTNSCVDELTLLVSVHRALLGEENLVVIHKVVSNSLIHYINLFLAETGNETISYSVIIKTENNRVFTEFKLAFVVLHVHLAVTHCNSGGKYLLDSLCLGVE